MYEPQWQMIGGTWINISLPWEIHYAVHGWSTAAAISNVQALMNGADITGGVLSRQLYYQRFLPVNLGGTAVWWPTS